MTEREPKKEIRRFENGTPVITHNFLLTSIKEGYITQISPRNRMILKESYGIGMSDSQIGQKLGISKARVQALRTESLKRLYELTPQDFKSSVSLEDILQRSRPRRTEESKKKISAILEGRPKSPETRERMKLSGLKRNEKKK